MKTALRFGQAKDLVFTPTRLLGQSFLCASLAHEGPPGIMDVRETPCLDPVVPAPRKEPRVGLFFSTFVKNLCHRLLKHQRFIWSVLPSLYCYGQRVSRRNRLALRSLYSHPFEPSPSSVSTMVGIRIRVDQRRGQEGAETGLGCGSLARSSEATFQPSVLFHITVRIVTWFAHWRSSWSTN